MINAPQHAGVLRQPVARLELRINAAGAFRRLVNHADNAGGACGLEALRHRVPVAQVDKCGLHFSPTSLMRWITSKHVSTVPTNLPLVITMMHCTSSCQPVSLSPS